MSDNSWYEKGVLPPVGIECEVLRNSSWERCEIKTHMYESGQVCAFHQLNNKWGFDSSPKKYRPIKTERELAIEAASKCISAIYPDNFADMLGKLYDAGLLRSKNES